MGWQLDCRKMGAGPHRLSGCLSQGALDSQPGRGLCFWNVGSPVSLGGEECGGQLVRQWESSPAGRTGTLVSAIAECPVAPEHTVCSEETHSLLGSSLTHSQILIGLLEDRTCRLGLIRAVRCLIELDTHTHTHTQTQTHTQASMSTYSNP